MTGPSAAVLIVAVAVVAATSGWVYRDARGRGLSKRKATIWALLSSQEWPLMFLLYRRARPRGLHGETPPHTA